MAQHCFAMGLARFMPQEIFNGNRRFCGRAQEQDAFLRCRGNAFAMRELDSERAFSAL